MNIEGGFHDGELRVQRRAGVMDEARRLEPMLDLPDLSGGAGRFLAERTLAVIAGRDREGRLWISPLPGPAGFLRGEHRTLRVGAGPAPGDPLHGLPPGQPIALIAIDFAARRRLRVNGRLAAAGAGELTVEVDQAYGNCPQYIHRRTLWPADRAVHAADTHAPVRADALGEADRALVAAADTFFLGTSHPTRGADASHRGGPPGFVHADGSTLWWPDFPGNNMFNSFGNLAVDPVAALVFVDWDDGTVLALSGTARVEWDDESGDDGGTGRRVDVTVEAVVRWHDPRLRAVPDR